MRKKLLTMILLTSLALSGCGSSSNGELDKISNKIKINQDGTVKETEATKSPTKTPTAASENGAEDTSADKETPADNTANNSEENSTEEEKYFVTFEAITTEGTDWNSDKFANSKLTMINVWGTYCNPCLSEMPALGELAAEYDSALFQIVGVISDVMEGDSADNINNAKRLITETGANYPHLLLNESLYMSFVGAVSAVPTTFFVRQDGSMVGYLTGAMAKENWKILIEDLLAKEQ